MRNMSVSYTHLDVYKRQIFDCVKREFIWCDMNMSLRGVHMNTGGNNLESNLSGVTAVCYSMAVSYTHLDVYKRQGPTARASAVVDG